MKSTSRIAWVPAAALTLALAGCGGGGSDAVAVPPVDNTAGSIPASVYSSVSALIDFAKQSIAGTSNTAEPLSLGTGTLAIDNTAEPSPL